MARGEAEGSGSDHEHPGERDRPDVCGTEGEQPRDCAPDQGRPSSREPPELLPARVASSQLPKGRQIEHEAMFSTL